MGPSHDRAVLRQLQTLFAEGTTGDLTDGQLLERFTTEQSDIAHRAFAILVDRHGPMVLRACQGILIDPNDAQDAFQATFFVLARKARRLWTRDSLGPWLYQVAYRTALCAKRNEAKRRRLDRRAAVPVVVTPRNTDSELIGILHQEIDRLPERFRSPIVLCDIEGLTHEKAAQLLGWPTGTVKSRHARGRIHLGVRLRRRGLAPAAGLTAMLTHPSGHSASLTPMLVSQMSSAASQFLKTRTLIVGSSTALAREVLRSMTITGSLKIATVALVIGATFSGVGLSSGKQFGIVAAQVKTKAPEDKNAAVKGAQDEKNVSPAKNATITVKPGNLDVTVHNQGFIDSPKDQFVVNQVQEPTTVLSLVPEGTQVRKGDVIGELDTSTLHDLLTQLEIETQQAEAAYKNARLTREVAEIATTEYDEGPFRQERLSLMGEIELAQMSREKAINRRQRSLQYLKRAETALNSAGAAEHPTDILATLDIAERCEVAELDILRHNSELGRATLRLKSLEEQTKPKTLKSLSAAVEKAKIDELEKQQAYDVKKSKRDKLTQQIKLCTVRATADGIVDYSRWRDGVMGNPRPVRIGEQIQERQAICNILNLTSPMTISMRVPEALVGMLKPGQKARIKIAAFPDENFTGAVQDISPIAAPGQRGVSPEYPIRVAIDQTMSRVRPKMTADVEIETGKQLNNVIKIPKQSLMNYTPNLTPPRGSVWIRKPDGNFEQRGVTVGRSNEESIEVKQGLQEGDEVLLDPAAANFQ